MPCNNFKQHLQLRDDIDDEVDNEFQEKQEVKVEFTVLAKAEVWVFTLHNQIEQLEIMCDAP